MPKSEETQPRVGIQLYTVRDLTGDDTFRETLRSLADLGFAGVEFAWKYGGMSPAELADFLESIGLACCGLHVKLNELLDPDHEVYDYARATGSPFITTSLAGRTAEWDDLLPQLENVGRIAAENGLAFTYHNHHQEFEGHAGTCAYDRLVAETDPALVQLELDIGWARKGGLDPLALWQSQAARIPQIHLRDFSVEKDQVCDVGDGFIDPTTILDRACELGTRWVIYEQDRYPVSALESCRTCVERLALGKATAVSRS